jgi:hypothetical protein
MTHHVSRTLKGEKAITVTAFLILVDNDSSTVTPKQAEQIKQKPEQVTSHRLLHCNRLARKAREIYNDFSL